MSSNSKRSREERQSSLDSLVEGLDLPPSKKKGSSADTSLKDDTTMPSPSMAEPGRVTPEEKATQVHGLFPKLDDSDLAIQCTESKLDSTSAQLFYVERAKLVFHSTWFDNHIRVLELADVKASSASSEDELVIKVSETSLQMETILRLLSGDIELEPDLSTLDISDLQQVWKGSLRYQMTHIVLVVEAHLMANIPTMQPQLAFAILIQADKHNRSKIKNACLASRLLKVPYNDIPESKLSKLSKHTLIELSRKCYAQDKTQLIESWVPKYMGLTERLAPTGFRSFLS